MVLTQSQHENNSKEELIQDLTKINSSPVNDINAKLSDLSDMFNKLRQNLIKSILSCSYSWRCFGGEYL